MDSIEVRRPYKLAPIIAQFAVLALAVLVLELWMKQTISSQDELLQIDVVSYSLYVFVFLSLTESLLRKTQVRESITLEKEGLMFVKHSALPLPGYNSRRLVHYGTIERVYLSKQKMDLGQDERFYSKLTRKLSTVMLGQKHHEHVRNDVGLHYMTILRIPRLRGLTLGILDLNADMANYNIRMQEKDIDLVLLKLNNKVNLGLLFN